MATKVELSGKWKTIAGAVKKKYGQITDNDLKQVEGNLDQLAGLIQKKTGQTQKQIKEFYEECCGSVDSVGGQAAELAGGAGEAVRERYDKATEQARQGYNETIKTVAQKPLASVGIALGVGIVCGLIIGTSIGAQRERELSWYDRWKR
ncbi:CsbD family protein [Gimesia algae]|uniref:CsbD-like domain-containing protein n=1 Tax=Gimesia algae TaxID=2527971 RepID=A0A517VCS7_9PLAN|nr:CsbD family protein [Gimesia algae]QDT90811.1 hypothetical protein Pan161_24650 [Gimesia algae]